MTQKEIAKALCLSQSTVSLALAGSAKISEKIRLQVQELASKRGYAPNLNARALQTRKSKLIGVIFPDFSQAYYNELKKDIHSLLKERGYSGMFLTAGDDGDTEHLVAELQGRGIEGLIAGSVSSGNLQSLCQSGFPVVFYRKPDALPCSTVDVDRYEGGYLAGRHLVSLGYRSIACLGVERSFIEERFLGFMAALSESGIEIPNELLIQSRQGMAGGYEGFSAFFKSGVKRPRAVFAFNDTTAIGGMRAASDFRLRIPQDLAFMGFDDIQEARFAIPSLSTVAQPRFETAKSLVDLIFKRMSGEDISLRHIRLKTSLVIRESCGSNLN